MKIITEIAICNPMSCSGDNYRELIDIRDGIKECNRFTKDEILVLFEYVYILVRYFSIIICTYIYTYIYIYIHIYIIMFYMFFYF